MQPHQVRVLKEKEELDEKLYKLRKFMTEPLFDTFDEKEKERMISQAVFMKAYSTILGERIQEFT